MPSNLIREDRNMEYMWLVWLVLAIAALVVEALTMGLTSVWLAAGCLVAMVLDLCGADLVPQIVVMLIVTIATFVICIIWIKPRLDKKRNSLKEATNADRIIGMEGEVTKAIDPVEGKGQIKVMGQVWSAKSEHPINAGVKVKVTGIEGVKAVVEQKVN